MDRFQLLTGRVTLPVPNLDVMVSFPHFAAPAQLTPCALPQTLSTTVLDSRRQQIAEAPKWRRM